MNGKAAKITADPLSTELLRDRHCGSRTAEEITYEIAYIVENKRISPNSPVAQPLSGWMKESLLFLSADTAEVEHVWLSALGMGAMEA